MGQREKEGGNFLRESPPQNHSAAMKPPIDVAIIAEYSALSSPNKGGGLCPPPFSLVPRCKGENLSRRSIQSRTFIGVSRLLG